jgi:hypothetical protein
MDDAVFAEDLTAIDCRPAAADPRGARLPFPSVAWFERLSAVMRDDEDAYRELGPVDCVMVAAIAMPDGPRRLFAVTFAGYGVVGVRELASLAEAPRSYFVIEGTLQTWRAMIENIARNGTPDLIYTLNSLTLPDDPMRLDGPDQLEIDAFYRYNQSLQRFFDGAAAVPTVFPE